MTALLLVEKSRRERKERLRAEQRAWLENPGDRATPPGTLARDFEELGIAWRPLGDALREAYFQPAEWLLRKLCRWFEGE